MGNSAWICFDCREAVRRDTQYRGDVPCPKCGTHCYCLGYKIPVPPKRDVKTWDELRAQLREELHIKQAQALEQSVRRRHQIEQEIAKLEALPNNAGRQAAIRELHKRLEST